jgi:hypothetical protein
MLILNSIIILLIGLLSEGEDKRVRSYSIELLNDEVSDTTGDD